MALGEPDKSEVEETLSLPMGERVVETVAEQKVCASRPGEVQHEGCKQGVGADAPAGQKLPVGQRVVLPHAQ